ncbi:phosphatidate cytidylyltransferase [Thiomicrorhabdus sp. zzn3]|uniref:phosphatidate cytidylyltransferase n=1 Tax=Thiomicrorhabdus sp. zzn3 TaxID=3039775 RepID=UPI002436E002|nr:phosphatidate cytidylyltransferase [Thiomicrorhabdus sp. zzn3]MDG6777981.1 phosphatidate cytidylyltransferase [Thiomicrorhabdus sp. zzn3]
MLKQRIITAFILAIGAIVALYAASNTAWMLLIMGLTLLAAWEWSGFAEISNRAIKGGYALATALSVYLGLSVLETSHIILLTLVELAITFGVVGRYQASHSTSGVHSKWLILLSGWLLIGLFALTMIRFREELSAGWLLLSLLMVWVMDSGAYFSGRRFGKRKLAQFVSPGKTWEGVWGGALFVLIAALVSLSLLTPDLNMPLWLFALSLSAIALYSVVGDLFESVLKRQANLKDSGTILPGHGGVLDRIDSLLVAVPVFYLLWWFGSLHA